MTDALTQDIFELVLVRGVNTASGEHPHLAHLWWRAPEQTDRLVQIYIDGLLYDVTPSPDVFESWLVLDRSRMHSVELLAVDPALADPTISYVEHLTALQPPIVSNMAIALLPDPTLPIDTQIVIDDAGETIHASPLWSLHVPRGGFGALHGLGGLGFDDATGPGLGAGELGIGPLGSDGFAFRYDTSALAPGEHTLLTNAVNQFGETLVDAPLETNLTIDPPVRTAQSLELQPDFTFTWN